MVSEPEEVSLASGYPQSKRDVVLSFRESAKRKLLPQACPAVFYQCAAFVISLSWRTFVYQE